MAKILVIEDHFTLGKLYQTVLGRNGHDVILAQDGETGVAAAALARPDLVIIDLVLPGMSGQQAAIKLLEAGTFPDTPLIITTALNEGDARTVADSLGAASVLVKPFDIDQMLASVQGALLTPDSGSPAP